jgi:hypothetical protein
MISFHAYCNTGRSLPLKSEIAASVDRESFVFSLTQTNIEEKILIQSPHIITNEGGQISYKEFARRLEVTSTSEVLQQLFRMYDKVIIFVPIIYFHFIFCLEISKILYNAGS